MNASKIILTSFVILSLIFSSNTALALTHYSPSHSTPHYFHEEFGYGLSNFHMFLEKPEAQRFTGEYSSVLNKEGWPELNDYNSAKSTAGELISPKSLVISEPTTIEIAVKNTGRLTNTFKAEAENYKDWADVSISSKSKIAGGREADVFIKITPKADGEHVLVLSLKADGKEVDLESIKVNVINYSAYASVFILFLTLAVVAIALFGLKMFYKPASKKRK